MSLVPPGAAGPAGCLRAIPLGPSGVDDLLTDNAAFVEVNRSLELRFGESGCQASFVRLGFRRSHVFGGKLEMCSLYRVFETQQQVASFDARSFPKWQCHHAAANLGREIRS